MVQKKTVKSKASAKTVTKKASKKKPTLALKSKIETGTRKKREIISAIKKKNK